MMRDLRLRCILFLFTALALFAAPASAQNEPWQAEADTLASKFFFLKKLEQDHPDAGFADTFVLLEAEARTGRDRYQDAAAFSDLHREVLLTWGRSLLDRKRPADALSPFTRLIDEYGKDDAGYREAATAAAEIRLGMAEAAETDGDKLDQLSAARDLYRKIDDAAKVDELRNRIVDLQCSEGLRLTEAREYEKALERLSAVEAEEGDLGTGKAAEALAFLREKTGVLTIRLIEVEAEGTEVGADSRLRLDPSGAGEQTEVAFALEYRWVVGEYDVKLLLPGQSGPAVTARIRLDPKGASVQFPRKFPPGMVYVPGRGEVRPFFIDRCEVTIEEYRAFKPEYKPPFPGENYPAHGIPFEDAQAYAAFVKKRLPTPEQWQWAAFGENARQTYPWGEADPKGRCNIGTQRPVQVDSYADLGRSPFGVLNMAGNVWEWQRNGYAIGGGFRFGALQAKLKVPGDEWTADFLRVGKPDEAVYGDLVGADQRHYSLYRIKRDSNLVEVGIRCVIEL